MSQVSVRNIDTGGIVFYSTYDEARSAASAGDVISIYANLNEQIVLKDGVDIYIDHGTIIEYGEGDPTIVDLEACICNITGGGIIKNSNKECILIVSSGSKLSVECLRIETESAVAIDFTDGSMFRLICDSVSSVDTNTFDEEFRLKFNYIQGNYTGGGNSLVVYINGNSTNPAIPVLINAKIRNLNTISSSKGIYLENNNPKVTLMNVKIIAGDGDNDIIFLSSGDIDIRNYGLFGKYDIDNNIDLLIGTSGNNLFIESIDLT